jgi:hypothetical protein
MQNPSGALYDGTIIRGLGQPAFGTGLIIDYKDEENFYPVSIARRLPESWSATPIAGDLTRQLRTTADEFILRTQIYGSEHVWVKAGALDQSDCFNSEEARLNIVSEGMNLEISSKGNGTLNPLKLSNLNVCINRDMIERNLQPGDHGALISAYRIVNGRVAAIPSFILPVYLTIPHHTLAGSTGYSIQEGVASFEVKRNYVSIPKGTTLVRVSLEVPPVKRASIGNEGESTQGCAGVELMALLGSNRAKPFKTRPEARVSNCDASGRPVSDESKRKLIFTQSHPIAGVWDLAVFGSYRYPKSNYQMHVDYFTATTSVQSIQGGLALLQGSFDFTILKSSLGLQPSLVKSAYEFNALESKIELKIKQGDHSVVSSPVALARSYPAEVKKVALRTGHSPGNDLDLFIFECAASAQSIDDPSCSLFKKSDGPTDEELVTFEPVVGKVYFVRVDGVEVKNDGSFTCKETLYFEGEKGDLSMTGKDSLFNISYAFSSQQSSISKLMNHDYFQSGKYKLKGSILVKANDGTILSVIPIEIANQK